MGVWTISKPDDRLEGGNQILGTFPELSSSSIKFYGENNVLYCENGVKVDKSALSFYGSNSLIYLSSNRFKYVLNVSIYNDSTLFIGENNYINDRLNLILSEGKNVVVGNDGLFSFGIWMRLADPHLIYDADTKCRINPSKSIYIGDHVWIGQDAMLLKGTQIGSGSILGAKSVLTGKKVPSNTAWGGVPAKQVKQNIFWMGNCVHGYRAEDTKRVETCDSDVFIYGDGDITAARFDIQKIEQSFFELKTAGERLAFVKETFRETSAKNRFYVQSEKGPVKF